MEADDVFLHGRNRQVLDHQTLTSKYMRKTLVLSILAVVEEVYHDAPPDGVDTTL